MHAMKGRTESVELAVEILTPVQSGSGVRLIANQHFVDLDGSVFVVDHERTFAAIAAGDAALDRVLSGAALSDLVELAGQRFGYCLKPLSGRPIVPTDAFREQLKDGFLQPYLPGSALKGAIRTVLFATAMRGRAAASYRPALPCRDTKSQKSNVSAKKAAKGLTDELFGKEPNRDVLRALHVGDARFRTDDLCLADIRWFNLTGRTEPFAGRWRDMPSRTSKERWEEASGIYCEMLAPDALAPITLQWDRFLLSNLDWHRGQADPEFLPGSFDALSERLNAHAKRRLTDEAEFYGKYRQSGAKKECERLLTMIEGEPAAYLQLSWGSGWKGMTGDWMSTDIQTDMRNLYREMKGREGMPFPKTRRLAVKANQPSLPLGWVRLLSPERAAAALAMLRNKQRQQAARCAWVDETIAAIMAQHRAKPDDALKGKALAEAWMQLGDAGLKHAALVDIRSRWQAKGWWDQALSGAARKAKAIYDSGTQPK